MNVSIAIATYNGEKYFKEQLESIINQLGPEDEIVISDDGSSDATLGIADRFSTDRIRIYKNPGKGVKSNFENAVKHARNDVILLCDQDDVWENNKINIVKKYFEETGADLIVSDAYVTDENLNIIYGSFYNLMKSGSGFTKNFIKNTFLGCCMAFRNNLKDIIIPFPERIPMHDSWIGLLAELNGKVVFIPEKLIYYRRHDRNATALKSKSLFQTLLWRKDLLKEIIIRQHHIRGKRNNRKLIL